MSTFRIASESSTAKNCCLATGLASFWARCALYLSAHSWLHVLLTICMLLLISLNFVVHVERVSCHALSQPCKCCQPFACQSQVLYAAACQPACQSCNACHASYPGECNHCQCVESCSWLMYAELGSLLLGLALWNINALTLCILTRAQTLSLMSSLPRPLIQAFSQPVSWPHIHQTFN